MAVRYSKPTLASTTNSASRFLQKMNRYFMLLPLLVLTSPVWPDDVCFDRTETQYELNLCGGLYAENADDELEAVLTEIKSVYSGQTDFLEKLEQSQNAWLALREANLQLYFPQADKKFWYGSAFPMCEALKHKELTYRRIEFLKKWLRTPEEGMLCSGSVGSNRIH